MVATHPARAHRPRARPPWRVLAVLAAGSVLAACTPEPVPDPSPTPTAEETSEAPSGVRVAVVLPPVGDPSAATFLDPSADLARLAEERVGDVARIEPVVLDDADFVPDTAAYLAETGADLVCLLSSDGGTAVRALADRFPATRFCAIAPARDDLPDNVDLLDIDHEALGHVLGVAAGSVGSTVGIVLGDDAPDRIRRRDGARAALAEDEVPVDTVVTDPVGAGDLVATVAEADLDVLIVDGADAGVASVVAAAVPAWVGPRGVAVDASAGPAFVRWSLRADAVIGAAIDGLVGERDPDTPDVLGFDEEVFTLSFTEGIDERRRAAVVEAAEQLAAGTRDPLGTRRQAGPAEG